jgi:glucose/arabinose dehydrogenase
MIGSNRVAERQAIARASGNLTHQTATATVIAALICSVAISHPAHAGFTGLQRVATGLSSPMFTTFAPGDPTRLFIATRGTPTDSATSSATIRVLDLSTPTPTLLSTPFLTIPNVDNRGEGGLLGLAFHPEYATNGKFYVNITAADSVSGTYFSNYIREYTKSSDPNIANTSFNQVLTFGQPQSNHNGGWIGFGPNDDYLYIMTGDGGNGDDTGTGHVSGGNAQSTTANLLGKALRVDVNGDDFASTSQNYRIPDSNPFADVRNEDREVTAVVAGLDEIWSFGLRNPFRAGFDRATGDLWIGDVGQGRREEIDFQLGTSAGGENYGWRVREGLIQTPAYPIATNPVPPGAVNPIWDYKHDGSPDLTPADTNFTGPTVVGGVPYRGPDPTLQGVYFFADTYANRI